MRGSEFICIRFLSPESNTPHSLADGGRWKFGATAQMEQRCSPEHLLLTNFAHSRQSPFGRGVHPGQYRGGGGVDGATVSPKVPQTW